MPNLLEAKADGNPPSKESLIENDMTLGKVPPKSERLKDSEGLKISKLCGESDWQPRFLAITADRIIIAHPGQDEIADQIPLVDVKYSSSVYTHSAWVADMLCRSTKFLDQTSLLGMETMLLH